MTKPQPHPIFFEILEGEMQLPPIRFDEDEEAKFLLRLLGECDTHATGIIWKLVHEVGVWTSRDLLKLTLEGFRCGQQGEHNPGGFFLWLAKKGDILSAEKKGQVFKKVKKGKKTVIYF